MIDRNFSEIEKRLNYNFKNRDLLFQAFTHSSFLNESREVIHDNERLEFLGDTVLGLIVAEYLYLTFPEEREGRLSFLRSQIVDSFSCAGFSKRLGLGKYLILGKGEKGSDRGSESILADLFEAILGAIYLDGGFLEAKNFFMNHFEEDIKNILKKPNENYKAEVQNYFQKNFGELPKYKFLKKTGPEHESFFEVALFFKDREMSRGGGKSRKAAEADAAKIFLKGLFK